MTSYKAILVCFLCVYLHTSFVCGSKKKGVAAWGSGLLCNDFLSLNNFNISWWYDYKNDLSTYHNAVTNVCPSSTHHLPQFVLLIWKSKWNGAIHMNVSSNAPFILVLNEPDQADQTNMTPQAIAELWPEIEKHSHGKPIVSPAAAHHNFQWYDEFFRICNGCRIDYIAAHAYSCNANHIMSYLEKAVPQIQQAYLVDGVCVSTIHR
ncbi:uncharacterized protein LOC123562618 [Mercenaria mercenaria]|uniref:uncharacterized protein LOC123562618 n=1 Tax=Mercenaria mercenaria TaxID=6596 RepID=UPI00234EA7D9|nr:uncharacterized protein LOC123562618 [Mercenaria mercenaria]